MKFLRLSLVLFTLIGAGAACSDEQLPDPPDTLAPTVTGVPSTTPTQTATTASECVNEATVTSNRALQNGPTRTADIDADGLLDDVFIEIDPSTAPPCSAFLVVATTTSVMASSVWELGSSGGLPEPSIHGIVDINDDGASEVLVDEATGASTQFLGAFTFLNGDLERVKASEKDAGPQDFPGLFGYGGSVGHLEGVGCTADGLVVISSAVPGPSPNGDYEVDRRFFSLDGSSLVLEKLEKKSMPAGQINSLPEYSLGPFGNC